MSIFVLLISVFFALIEAGLSYLVLAYEPVSSLFTAVPSFLLVGGIFAVGMLLTFLLIIIIGSMNIRCHAGDFVRNYFGKTVALALMSILIVGSLSLGAEALYQIRPAEQFPDKEGYEKKLDNPHIIDTLFTPRRTYSYVPIASEIEENVRNAGGNVDVPLRFSIQWSEPDTDPDDNNDVDAHSESAGEHIFFSSKQGAYSMGALDVDITHPNSETSDTAVENIMFPNIEKLKGKTFNFYIVCYAFREGTSGFRAEVEVGNQIYSYDYPSTLSHNQIVKVADVTVDQDGNMTIQHHLTPLNVVDLTPSSSESVEKKSFDFTSLINSAVMRCVLVFIIAFLFKLISIICIGKNDHSFLSYLLIAFVIAVIAALLLEFGYTLGLPLWAVLGIFWLLMTTLVVSAE